MAEEIPQNTPTIRGNVAVGVFVTGFLFFFIIFAFISVDNIVMLILIVLLPLSPAARFYYLMFKEINKIRRGYYNTISE